MRRTRYRFSHTSADGKTYHWYSVTPLLGDSRVELITCNRAWFWGGAR